MTSTKIRAVAAVLPALLGRLEELDETLPDGRTSDVIEVAALKIRQVLKDLQCEAAILAQGGE
jgi:hypothetical protein